MSDIVSSVLERLSSMKSRRGVWDSHVQECYDFVDPTNGQVTHLESPGEKRHEDIYDSTAAGALRDFVSGMYSSNTPNDVRWFEFSSSNEDIKENEDVSRFYNDVTRITYQEIAKSNFGLEIQSVFHQLGIPGRGTIFALEGEESLLRYQTFHYANTYIAENHLGLVDTLYREFKWTARQAYQRWGDKNSKKVQEAAASAKTYNDEFTFVHAIYPRTDRDIRFKNSENMPYASCWVELTSKHLVDESGFREKPFAIPRFMKDVNEVEGRSPTMAALADIKMLNAAALTVIKRANWDADPPMLLPDDDLLRLNTAPSARIPYRPTALGGKPEFLTINSRYDLAQWVFDKYEDSIKKSYFQDFFALMSSLDQGTERTAFEIQQRESEKIDLLSVARGRIKNELLDPLMQRTVNLLMRQNAFPEMPLEVRESPNFEIEYKGRMAILAKTLGLKSVSGWLEFMRPHQELAPELKDWQNWDGINKLVAETFGVPNSALTPKKEVSEIREVRAQQAEQERVAALATEAAKAVPSLQQPTDENSPLQFLAENAS